MKLKKEMVDYLSGKIADRLLESGDVEFDGDNEALKSVVDAAISSDLMVEDSLNEEVKNILREQEEQIDENNINYRKMFQMVKMKLARERGLIL